MTLGKVELVSSSVPLPTAIVKAFETLRTLETGALLFDGFWHPTMDVVELVADQLAGSRMRNLTLLHPSAAMSVIAAAIASRAPSVTVASRRSVYDEDEDDELDATESKTLFTMVPSESLDAFVRRTVREAHARSVRRFALVFHRDSRPTMAVADTLVEELLQSGVQELGLIHATEALDALAASVRLRMPELKVALSNERKP